MASSHLWWKTASRIFWLSAIDSSGCCAKAHSDRASTAKRRRSVVRMAGLRRDGPERAQDTPGPGQALVIQELQGLARLLGPLALRCLGQVMLERRARGRGISARAQRLGQVEVH